MDFNITGKIKNIYYSMEDQWYKTLDKINKKVPIYRVIDPIDNVFPSFILFIILVLFLSLISFYFIQFGGPTSIEIITYDSSTISTLSGVNVSGEIEGLEFDKRTDSRGTAFVDVPTNKNIYNILLSALFGKMDYFSGKISVRKPGYKELNSKKVSNVKKLEIFLEKQGSDVSLPQEERVNLKDSTRVKLIDSDSGQVIVDQENRAYVSYSCVNRTIPSRAVKDDFDRRLDGTFTLYEPQCKFEFLEAWAPGYNKTSNRRELTGTSPHEITLTQKSTQAKGTVKIWVKDKDKNTLVNGARIILNNVRGYSTSAVTTGGTINLELIPGNYSLTMLKEDYYPIKPSNNISVTVSSNQESRKTVLIEEISVQNKRKINFIVKNNSNIIENAKVSLINLDNGSAIDSGGIVNYIEGPPTHTDSNGVYDRNGFSIRDEGEVVAIIEKEGYQKTVFRPTLMHLGSNPEIINMTQLNQSNSGNVNVSVFSGENKQPLSNTKVSLFADYSFNGKVTKGVPIEEKFTDSDGKILFENVPAGIGWTYFAKAFTQGVTSNPSSKKDLGAGQTISLNVYLDFNVAQIKIIILDGETDEEVTNGTIKLFEANNQFTELEQLEEINYSNGYVSQIYDKRKAFFIKISAPNYNTGKLTIDQGLLNEGINEFEKLLFKLNSFETIACETNDDCPDGSACGNGECIVVETCRDVSDCEAEEICDSGICASSCTIDSECDKEEICSENGGCLTTCIENNDCLKENLCYEGVCAPVKECNTDSECDKQQRQTCVKNKCVIEDIPCQTNNDCLENNSLCIEGACEIIPECNTNEDCETNNCVNNLCATENNCTVNSDCNNFEICDSDTEICRPLLIRNVSTWFGGVFNLEDRIENGFYDSTVQSVEKNNEYYALFYSTLNNTGIDYNKLLTLTRTKNAEINEAGLNPITNKSDLSIFNCTTEQSDNDLLHNKDYYFPDCAVDKGQQAGFEFKNLENTPLNGQNEYFVKFKVTGEKNNNLIFNYRAKEINPFTNDYETKLKEEKIIIGKKLYGDFTLGIEIDKYDLSYLFPNEGKFIKNKPVLIPKNSKLPFKVTLTNKNNDSINADLTFRTYQGNPDDFSNNSPNSTEINLEGIRNSATISGKNSVSFDMNVISYDDYSSNYIIITVKYNSKEINAFIPFDIAGEQMRISSEFIAYLNQQNMPIDAYNINNSEAVNIREYSVKTYKGCNENELVEYKSGIVNDKSFSVLLDKGPYETSDCARVKLLADNYVPKLETFYAIGDRLPDTSLACIQITGLQGEKEEHLNWNDTKNIKIVNNCNVEINFKIDSLLECSINNNPCYSHEATLSPGQEKEIRITGKNTDYDEDVFPNFTDLLGNYNITVFAKKESSERFVKANEMTIHLNNLNQCFSIDKDELDFTQTNVNEITFTNECKSKTLFDSKYPDLILDAIGYKINEGTNIPENSSGWIDFNIDLEISGKNHVKEYNDINNTIELGESIRDVNFIVNSPDETSESTGETSNNSGEILEDEELGESIRDVNFIVNSPDETSESTGETSNNSGEILEDEEYNYFYRTLPSVGFVQEADKLEDKFKDTFWETQEIVLGVMDTNYSDSKISGAKVTGSLKIIYLDGTEKNVDVKQNFEVYPDLHCGTANADYPSETCSCKEIDDFTECTTIVDIPNGKVAKVEGDFISNVRVDNLQLYTKPVIKYTSREAELVEDNSSAKTKSIIGLGSYAIPINSKYDYIIWDLRTLSALSNEDFVNKFNTKINFISGNPQIKVWVKSNYLLAKYIGTEYTDKTITKEISNEFAQGTTYNIINIQDIVRGFSGGKEITGLIN